MKTIRTQIPFYLLPLLLLLFSCQKEPDVIPTEETIPLQVGNEWVYEVYDYDTLGNVLSTTASRTAVLRDTIINNSTWFILNDRSIVQNSSDGYVYYNRAGNQAVMLYQSSRHGGIGYMYKYPNYDLWVLTTRTYELAPIQNHATNLSGYTFEIKREHLQPATSTKFTFRQKDYVSPEVGMVRSDRYFVDSEKIMRRYELKSYRVK